MRNKITHAFWALKLFSTDIFGMLMLDILMPTKLKKIATILTL